jgi:hypothetical protein
MDSRNSDEIDLLALFTKAARAVKENLILIILLTLAGLGVGLASSFVVNKQYESQMIISSDILTFSYVDRIIGTLNELIKEEDRQELLKRLKIDEETAAKIKSIEVELLIRGKDEVLPENEKNYLVVKARTLDSKVLPSLQQGLIDYLQNNDYVKVRVKQRNDYLKTLIAEVDKQIKSLEELKGNIYSGAFFQGSKGNLSFDPTTVNSKIIELSKDKLEYQNRLELVSSIQIIEGFTPHYKPVTGRKFRSSMIGALVGCIISLLVIALKSLDKELRKSEIQKS